ncbi:MAG: transhydrogenase beta subunit [Haloplasmataceae bacterium]|nr:transhydrogenase beta subunit [Haloplasmataceae bacterium]
MSEFELFYYIICGILTVTILFGISLMSKVKTAVMGNLISAIATAIAIVVTLIYYDILSQSVVLTICLITLAIGTYIGMYVAKRVKMIQMPELVALLNGFGGLASAIVGACTMFTSKNNFELVTSILALIVGALTFTGSLIAALKLAKLMNGRPVVWNKHQLITTTTIIFIIITVVLTVVNRIYDLEIPVLALVIIALALGSFFGIAFAIRVGGADMPITISLLNSLSGVAGSIAGMAIGDILLVAVGGIVGASGLLLTQIMCKAMNRSLMDILLGKTSVSTKVTKTVVEHVKVEEKKADVDVSDVLKNAKKVIIVPGYGMALAQAQQLVKQISDTLEKNGTEVKFAIHPVAGRMPGHMNVLLCEVDIPYEKLYELNDINDEFKDCDACIVVGANDVTNPAARDAVGTPIYGMPILNVDQAKHIIICNYDLKPGYAGVENSLYKRSKGVTLLLGNASVTLKQLLNDLVEVNVKKQENKSTSELLKQAKKVIIVPGYGMALAQAQHLVKQLSEKLASNGANVKFAIHPVAGRMPGHMNVLLCEAGIEYEQLYEMNDVNDEFKDTDVCIVVGANDVMNPAARNAEGTPIYGMPILNVDQAKHVIICNYDLKPGYAGVENPLYKRESGVTLLLGNAGETLKNLLSDI